MTLASLAQRCANEMAEGQVDLALLHCLPSGDSLLVDQAVGFSRYGA